MSSFEGHFTDFPTKGCSKFSLSVARFCSSFETFKLSMFQCLNIPPLSKRSKMCGMKSPSR